MDSHNREHPRITASISVTIQSKGGVYKSQRITNISLGGVFIAMAEPLGFGADLALEFYLPGDASVLRCKGFVIWNTKTKPKASADGPGMGVRLTDIAVVDMRRLADYIDAQKP